MLMYDVCCLFYTGLYCITSFGFACRCLLLVVGRCWLFTDCRSLSIVWCCLLFSVFGVWCMVFGVCGMLFVVLWLFVDCSLIVVRCSCLSFVVFVLRVSVVIVCCLVFVVCCQLLCVSC